jgi:poly(3-hydroxyalkanoate) synthetase
MPPVGFEHTIQVSERPQTYALDRAATQIGIISNTENNYKHATALTNSTRYSPCKIDKNGNGRPFTTVPPTTTRPYVWQV